MSGYRRLKRALGETNIERKCRILFGVCLALLIFAASFGVDKICNSLVNNVIHQAGKDAVDWAMVAIHYKFWVGADISVAAEKRVLNGIDEALLERVKTSTHWKGTDNDLIALFQPPSNGAKTETPTKYDELLELFLNDLKRERFDYHILHLQDEETTWLTVNNLSIPAVSEQEAEVLQRLREQWKEQFYSDQALTRESPVNKTKETPSGATVPGSSAPMPSESTALDIPFERTKYKSDYYYYQPVVWTKTCLICHGSPLAGSITASDMEGIKSETPPFRVFRVIMGDEETQEALTWVRATLIGTGILTLFVAMLGLYVIVKYVIVKPLTHLRDVSDAISQGNMQQRADIHTNDEFEELADAFNRMLRHITEAQGQLQASNTKLDAKVDELAQANMQLYDMNRLKSDFLANMSHELRTPLNSIIGFSDVLHGIDSLTDKQRRYAQNIQKSGRILLDMINDILDLAKLEAGKMELRPTEFRLDMVITAQCDMMRSLTEDKNIDLEVTVDPDAPPIYQDQSKVLQILTNLLSNAIKFTPEGGRITVRAVQTYAEQLELTVADTGVGIPEEDRDIIFEKFRQSKTVLGRDRLTREYSGTGLGLSIVKELCKLLGGEITFTSELGKGSTFRVVLPWSLPNRTRAHVPGGVESLGSRVESQEESRV